MNARANIHLGIVRALRDSILKAMYAFLELIEDLRYCWRQARQAWKFARYMRRGGNPDEIPFN